MSSITTYVLSNADKNRFLSQKSFVVSTTFDITDALFLYEDKARLLLSLGSKNMSSNVHVQAFLEEAVVTPVTITW